MHYKKEIYSTINNSFGKDPLREVLPYHTQNRMEDIARYHHAILESEKSDCISYVDESTWNDLEMNQIFSRINHTHSTIGEQMLYHQLHRLQISKKDEKPANTFENRLNTYKNNPDLRIETEAVLHGIGKSREDCFLFEFLSETSAWKLGNPGVYHLLQILLVGFGMLSILTGAYWAIGALITVALVNLAVYVCTKQRYEVYLQGMMDFLRIYSGAEKMKKHFEKESLEVGEEVTDALQQLKKLSGLLGRLAGQKRSYASGDLVGIINEYIFGVTLIDLTIFCYLKRIIGEKREAVFQILNFIGTTDAEISVASFRESLPYWCEPEFAEDEIEIKQIIHPLLENAIPNDWAPGRCAIITGSNASGKSTFMKSLAINCILAQTIHTCTAKYMRIRPYQVRTCMALRDDIRTGESYYYREAKCLESMISCSDDANMLLVIDEMLKGTNSRERIAASKAIIEYLESQNAQVVVATHDLELTNANGYENYHFSSEIKNDNIVFDYKIHKGINAKSNAIALLDLLGYPETIIRRAKEYADANQ